MERFEVADGVKLKLVGALDALTIPLAERELEAVTEGPGCRVVLDLSQLERIDGSGVGAIVTLFRRLTASGRSLGVEGLQGQPRAIFRLLKLDWVLGLE